MRLQQQVEAIKHQAESSTPGSHSTFGAAPLSKEQTEAIASVVKRKNEEKSVPLEHALTLVKLLLKSRTANMELENYINELKAQLDEAGHTVPLL